MYLRRGINPLSMWEGMPTGRAQMWRNPPPLPIPPSGVANTTQLRRSHHGVATFPSSRPPSLPSSRSPSFLSSSFLFLTLLLPYLPFFSYLPDLPPPPPEPPPLPRLRTSDA